MSGQKTNRRTVLHGKAGERTFTYNGQTYLVVDGGPGYGHDISAADSGAVLADGFFTLRQVRDYVDWCRENDLQIGEDQHT